jgi:hypothetical protein
MTEQDFIQYIQRSDFSNDAVQARLFPSLTSKFTTFKQKINSVTTLDQLFNEMILYSSYVFNDITYPPDCLNSCSGDDSPYSRFAIGLFDNILYLRLFLTKITNENLNDTLFIVSELFQMIFVNPIKYETTIKVLIDHPIIGRFFTIYLFNIVHYTDENLNLEEITRILNTTISYYKDQWIGQYHIRPTWDTYIPCTWEEKEIEFNIVHYTDIMFFNNNNIIPVQLSSITLENCIECFICAENINTICILPCAHQIHDKCINEWIISNKSCPLCRHKI